MAITVSGKKKQVKKTFQELINDLIYFKSNSFGEINMSMDKLYSSEEIEEYLLNLEE